MSAPASGPRGGSSPGSGTDPRVVLYGRAGCHLCDDAREVVRLVCAEAGADWAEADVDDDPTGDLARRYGEYVPVVTVDDVQQAFWRVDPARLRRALGVGG